MTAISIVIATRNRRQFLSEAIEMIRAQTMPDWELIVVDDASSDDTPEYLRGLHDPKISWMRLEQQSSQGPACNAALAQARGTYVMFLDDDDLLRRDTLEKLKAALDADPRAVSVTGACRLFRDDGDSVRPYRPARAYTRVMWREFLYGWWSNSGQNLHRTAVVREIGGFDPAIRNVHDRKLWLELSLRGLICVLPDVTMEYRQHPSQNNQTPGIPERRAALWQWFIDNAPRSHQQEARRVRVAAGLVEQAHAARIERRFARSMLLQLRACLTAPALVASPFLFRPLWWGLKKSMLRSSAS